MEPFGNGYVNHLHLLQDDLEAKLTALISHIRKFVILFCLTLATKKSFSTRYEDFIDLRT